MKLNLTTNCTEHTVLKEYLEENVSATLADKINHGVFIEKDGKRLLNRKDLNGFMQYACDEARKLAAKGATSACLKSDIVFGWAIHYFEEDDIIGKLYNEDGSEYTPPKPEYKPVQQIPAPTVPQKPKSTQASLFDFLASSEHPKDEPTEEKIEEPEDTDEEESKDIETLNVDRETGEIIPKTPIRENPSPLYKRYMKIQEQYPDYVIAYRVGDFFEIFGDTAIKVSKDLDLTLTGRDCGLANRIPMVGFPYHAADTYFKNIAKRNLLVVVDDEDVTIYQPQQETPADSVDEDDDFEEERKRQQYFDKDALCILYELFDGDLDMQ